MNIYSYDNAKTAICQVFSLKYRSFFDSHRITVFASPVHRQTGDYITYLIVHKVRAATVWAECIFTARMYKYVNIHYDMHK